MDFQSSWYAVQNVLEYFFWFSSRAYFHASMGAAPLVGTTVFVRRQLLEAVHGWDEGCLSEDAELGLRLSACGEPIRILYDPTYATREETPPTIASFVKQRTRWNQGALQVLRQGEWRRLPRRHQRLLAVFTLACPFVQMGLDLLAVGSTAVVSGVRLPPLIALGAAMPLGLLGVRYVIHLAGLVAFASSYRLRIRARDLVTFTLGFLPYQALLDVGALRALYRTWRGRTGWEKTVHRGAHRRMDQVPRMVELPTL